MSYIGFCRAAFALSNEPWLDNFLNIQYGKKTLNDVNELQNNSKIMNYKVIQKSLCLLADSLGIIRYYQVLPGTLLRVRAER